MTAEPTDPGPPEDEHRVCLERARRTPALAGWQVDAGGREELTAAAGGGRRDDRGHQLDGT
ncbi:hypothetical protein ACIA5G_43745 [Amycolatopsis sp. NPDC051758]|uniref:hypothetical protein n=1 Tax=Amycolatopsis sp. NPDC051758 TaxID=3363935 RepID=UPI0037A1DA5B